jgi:hypothetical protein
MAEHVGRGHARALAAVFWMSLGAALAGYAWHRALPEQHARDLAERLPATFSPFAALSPADLAAKGLFGLGAALLILLLPWYLAAGAALLRHRLLAAYGRPELARVERVVEGGEAAREVCYAFVTPRGGLYRGRVELASPPPPDAGDTMPVLYLPWAPQVSHPRDAVWFEPRA